MKNKKKKTMTTTLVDVHVEFLRARGYPNLETWIRDPNHVYIARDGIIIHNGERFPRVNSPWANPFKTKDNVTLKSAIEQYYNYIVAKIIRGELYRPLYDLKGKELGCWCMKHGVHTDFQPPFQCHGQVIMWLINYYFPTCHLSSKQIM